MLIEGEGFTVSQKINSLYHFVTIPWFYEMFQKAIGRDRALELLYQRVLSKYRFSTVLDVGCGPAAIRDYLGDCDYLGVDLNQEHITFAAQKYAGRGQFECRNITDDSGVGEGPFDLVLCLGLLHHLDDNEAAELLRVLTRLLGKNGTLITLDPVYTDSQNWVAKKLKNLDSGQNVRDQPGYCSLFPQNGYTLESKVYDDMLRLPYSHCCNIISPNGDQA